MKKLTNLFVSADLPNDHLLVAFAREKNVRLLAQSLISFQDLNNTTSADYSVVFFSSPRSFNYFISSNKINDNVEIGVIGEGTKKHLNEFFSQIKFVGEQAGNPAQVAADFKAWLGDRTVLFPQAKKSNETISSVILDTQKIILPVYETLALPLVFPPQDIYVFTSPSNVSSFLHKNAVPTGAKVIAWGATTQKACEQEGITVWKTLLTSTYEELMDLLSL
jgi:uroporphyrinogen-III synthase